MRLLVETFKPIVERLISDFRLLSGSANLTTIICHLLFSSMTTYSFQLLISFYLTSSSNILVIIHLLLLCFTNHRIISFLQFFPHIHQLAQETVITLAWCPVPVKRCFCRCPDAYCASWCHFIHFSISSRLLS